MNYLLQDKLGRHTTGSLCRAASPAASIRKGLEQEFAELREYGKNRCLVDYPGFAGYFATEAQAMSEFFPGDILDLADRIYTNCDQDKVIDFIKSLDDESFFAKHKHQDLFNSWLKTNDPKAQAEQEQKHQDRCLNKILDAMRQSMDPVKRRFDQDLAQQAAEHYLASYMDDESNGDFYATFWYETWMGSNYEFW